MAGRTSQDSGASPKKRPSVSRSPRSASGVSSSSQRVSYGRANQQSRTQQPASRGSSRTSHSASSQRKARTSQNTHLYTAPSIWTKDTTKSVSSGNLLVRILRVIGHGLLSVVALLGKGLALIAHGLMALFSRSRAALAVFVVLIVIVVGGLVDFGLNVGKAYPGVRIGEIDVAGKTSDEITALVNETYATRLMDRTVVVFASEEAKTRADDEVAQAQDAALAQQLAVEEARANKLAWKADATSLQASIPSEQLASEALAVGRENGGLFARIGALLSGAVVEPRADYGGGSIETLASEIDATIGDPRVDFDIEVEDGTASVTAGHDGSMVDRSWFRQSLDQVFLQGQVKQGTFVAKADYAPLRIDDAQAQAVATAVNRAIGDGARFSYNESTWNASANDLGAWVATRVEEQGEGFCLVAYLDESKAKPALLSHLEAVDKSEPIHVTFEANGQDVAVLTDGTGTIPQVAEAVGHLNDMLFGQTGKATGADGAPASGTPVELSIGTGTAPASLSFDEAMDLGIVATISSFTTEFTTGAGTENRNHNIELVSEFLSNSVVKPGEDWSFNGVAGDCSTEERGFQGAGAIVDGEYDDAIGGGICQVATTMFNAVYDSGFPVVTRHNHSLYISSYPTGRDAAVSWPDLDLVWENDGESDVLVRLSCADGSVTATLYGVDPGYEVSTRTGEWSKGETYTTKTKVDESLAPGTSYVKTRGTDGTSITVIRTVEDESGTIVREDAFSSVYDPVNEVVFEGPAASDDTTE